MQLKLLKLFTVISFILITFDTGHIGGQFGVFIILGFLSDYKDFILSAFIATILITFIISSFKPFKPRFDFYLFLLGGFVLCIPIIMHVSFLFSKMKNRIDEVFYLTAALYLVIYATTLFKIIKEKN